MIKWSSKSKHRVSFKFILFISLIILMVITIISIITFSTPPTPPIEENKEPLGEYITVNGMEAEDLYDNDLIIVDCSSHKSIYKDHHLPNAIWTSNVTYLYELTDNVLVYSDSEEQAILFCETLMDIVTGQVYYLEGGYEAWVARL